MPVLVGRQGAVQPRQPARATCIDPRVKAARLARPPSPICARPPLAPSATPPPNAVSMQLGAQHATNAMSTATDLRKWATLSPTDPCCAIAAGGRGGTVRARFGPGRSRFSASHLGLHDDLHTLSQALASTAHGPPSPVPLAAASCTPLQQQRGPAMTSPAAADEQMLEAARAALQKAQLACSSDPVPIAAPCRPPPEVALLAACARLLRLQSAEPMLPPSAPLPPRPGSLPTHAPGSHPSASQPSTLAGCELDKGLVQDALHRLMSRALEACKPPPEVEARKPPPEGEACKPPPEGEARKPPLKGEACKPSPEGEACKPPPEEEEPQEEGLYPWHSPLELHRDPDVLLCMRAVEWHRQGDGCRALARFLLYRGGKFEPPVMEALELVSQPCSTPRACIVVRLGPVLGAERREGAGGRPWLPRPCACRGRQRAHGAAAVGLHVVLMRLPCAARAATQVMDAECLTAGSTVASRDKLVTETVEEMVESCSSKVRRGMQWVAGVGQGARGVGTHVLLTWWCSEECGPWALAPSCTCTAASARSPPGVRATRRSP